MKRIQIGKADGVGALAVDSLTITISKPLPKIDAEGQEYYKTADKQFNEQAMKLAEALQAVLPGGTWDRFVGICVRRHASYLRVTREATDFDGGK
jgi:hypothetical protein